MAPRPIAAAAVWTGAPPVEPAPEPLILPLALEALELPLALEALELPLALDALELPLVLAPLELPLVLPLVCCAPPTPPICEEATDEAAELTAAEL
jgi:hypothetical protein